MNNLTKYKRPKVLHNLTFKEKTGCGSLYITITYNEVGDPVEMFLNMGKHGGCIYSYTTLIARLVSSAWRHGIGIEEILKQFEDEDCPRTPEKQNSCGQCIANALRKFMEATNEKEKRKVDRQAQAPPGIKLRAMEGQGPQRATMEG